MTNAEIVRDEVAPPTPDQAVDRLTFQALGVAPLPRRPAAAPRLHEPTPRWLAAPQTVETSL